MTTTTTRIRSVPALAVAGLCATGTGFVLFEDIVRGGAFSVQHVMALVALVATMYMGHAVGPALRTRPVAAFGAALVFLAGTTYVVITSAGRTAHVMADKELVATEANAKYSRARAEATKLEAAYDKAAADTRKACATGAGPVCRGMTHTQGLAKADMDAAKSKADGLKPSVEASDYLQAASLAAVMFGGEKKALEAKLALFLPFVLALICEIGFLVASSLAVERIAVETVVTPKVETALTFERPLTSKEIEEVKRYTAEDVRRLESRGLTTSQIALAFDPSGRLNQGRVSELRNGRRAFVEVRS